MSEEQSPEGEEQQPEKTGVGGLFYRLALAGVGGVMLAQEEISNLLRRSSDEVDDTPKDPSSEEAEPLSNGNNDQIDTTITRVLHTFNVPSRGDVEHLDRQISALAAMVAELEKKQHGQ